MLQRQDRPSASLPRGRHTGRVKRNRILLAAFVGAAAVLLVPATAQAHMITISAPGGGGNGGVGTFHDAAFACDTSADGLGIRTRYFTSRGIQDFVGDANGSAAGCGAEAAFGGGTIVSFQVCKGSGTSEVCTGPRTVT